MAAVVLAGVLVGSGIAPSFAQEVAVEDSGAPIERIDVVLTNPSADTALNARVIDLIRKNLTLFPADRFVRSAAEVGLSRVRRSAQLAATEVSVLPGSNGTVIVTVEATLQADKIQAAGGGALLTGPAGDLPVLYDRNGTFVTGKLETLTMLYANSDAWYGRPDLFLNGNPLVDGTPAGSGATGWGEAFVHAGIYGITPLGETGFAYGGVSGILSGSAGRELFTDDTRLHFGIEDAYVGIVGGNTSGEGNRLVWNVVAGRKRYAISDGFLIANTAFNGDSRAALQSNPRWAADMLVLGQIQYNRTKVEAFYLDPDELPVVDSETRLAGIPSPDFAQSHLRNPENNLVREPLIQPVKEEEGAQARETDFDQFFEELLKAVGLDPNGGLPVWWQGWPARAHVQRWNQDLGLTEDQIIETARATRQDHPAPPDGPKALDRAMERTAKRASQSPAASSKLPSGKRQSQPTEGPRPSTDELAAFYANMVNSDGFLPANTISNTIRDAMLARGLVTPERLRARGVR